VIEWTIGGGVMWYVTSNMDDGSPISGRSSSAGPPRVAPIDKLSLPLTILLRPRGSASRCSAWRLVSGFMTMGALLTIG